MKKELTQTLKNYVSKRENDLKPTAMNFFFSHLNNPLTREIINICIATIKKLDMIAEPTSQEIAHALKNTLKPLDRDEKKATNIEQIGNTLDAAIRLVQAARVRYGKFKVWEQGGGQIHYDGPSHAVQISRGQFEDSIEEVLKKYPIKTTVGDPSLTKKGKIIDYFETNWPYSKEDILEAIIGDMSDADQAQYTTPAVKK